MGHLTFPHHLNVVHGTATLGCHCVMQVYVTPSIHVVVKQLSICFQDVVYLYSNVGVCIMSPTINSGVYGLSSVISLECAAVVIEIMVSIKLLCLSKCILGAVDFYGVSRASTELR